MHDENNNNELDLYNVPVLGQTTINLLLEQAKNEGLYPIADTDRSESGKLFRIEAKYRQNMHSEADLNSRIHFLELVFKR